MAENYIIEFNNANIYQKENCVLANVNLQIQAGEFVYLIGRVGSGKTSLIKVLNGELPLHSGNVRIMDFQLYNLKSKYIPNLRRRVGVVFQDFQLLTDRSVYDNLIFVLKATGWKDKSHMDNRIAGVLGDVGLLQKINSMPFQLSGGEQQRVAIARALLNEPAVILADEPTGNLDPDTSTHIMEILHGVSDKMGITVIMATHNYNILKNFPSQVLKCENQALTEAIIPSEQDLKDKLIQFGTAKGYEYELVYETVMKMYGDNS
ncbi:MAG: ATP-binding cassette domain-containing protein [Prevotellaceae bacterium]|jgi:cell division transport system ATP-binding protein|nr:ATP-binding cassette domain-containing protein [Prevotellaceae bacterium]